MANDQGKAQPERYYMTGAEIHFRYILWAATVWCFVVGEITGGMIALATAEILRVRATIRCAHDRDR